MKKKTNTKCGNNYDCARHTGQIKPPKVKKKSNVKCGNNYDCARHTGQVKPAKPKKKDNPPPVCPFNILTCNVGTNKNRTMPDMAANPTFGNLCNVGIILLSCAGSGSSDRREGGGGGKPDITFHFPGAGPNGPNKDIIAELNKMNPGGTGWGQGKNVVGEPLQPPNSWGVKPPQHPWGRGTTETRRWDKWQSGGGSWDDIGRWFTGGS